LQYRKPILNRPTRRRLYAVVAGFSLALWLFMTVAEAYSPLHVWLHGGKIPDNDDCAVVAIAHGKVETVVVAAPAPLPVTWIEIVSRPEFFVFRTVSQFLPCGRAPPVLPVVS
jgi:hypothetical protein